MLVFDLLTPTEFDSLTSGWKKLKGTNENELLNMMIFSKEQIKEDLKKYGLPNEITIKKGQGVKVDKKLTFDEFVDLIFELQFTNQGKKEEIEEVDLRGIKKLNNKWCLYLFLELKRNLLKYNFHQQILNCFLKTIEENWEPTGLINASNSELTDVIAKEKEELDVNKLAQEIYNDLNCIQFLAGSSMLESIGGQVVQVHQNGIINESGYCYNIKLALKDKNLSFLNRNLPDIRDIGKSVFGYNSMSRNSAVIKKQFKEGLGFGLLYSHNDGFGDMACTVFFVILEKDNTNLVKEIEGNPEVLLNLFNSKFGQKLDQKRERIKKISNIEKTNWIKFDEDRNIEK